MKRATTITIALLMFLMAGTPAMALDARQRPVWQTPTSPRADDAGGKNCQWKPVRCYETATYIECVMQNTCTNEQNVIRVPKTMIRRR